MKTDKIDDGYMTEDWGTKPESVPEKNLIAGKDSASQKTQDSQLSLAEKNKALNASGMVEGLDGVLRYDNGKPVGGSHTPNGNEAATKQAAMDKNTTALLEKLRQNNPNNYSDETLLTNYAMRHNAPIERARAKANPPKPRNGGIVIGGGHQAFLDRRRAFIENNPNAVSPSERARVLGSGTTSFSDAMQQQQNNLMNSRLANVNQQVAAVRGDALKRKTMQAERRAAMGEAFYSVLDGLKTNGRIETGANGRRFMVSEMPEEMIGVLNRNMRSNGGKSDYKNVMAYVEIGANGDQIGVPKIAYRSSADGQRGEGIFNMRTMSVSHYEPLLRDAYKTLGMSEEQANDMTGRMTAGYGSIRGTAKNGGLTFEQQKELKKMELDAKSNGGAKNEIAAQWLDVANANLNAGDVKGAEAARAEATNALKGNSSVQTPEPEKYTLAEDQGEYFIEGNTKDGKKRIMDQTQRDANGRFNPTGLKIMTNDDGSTQELEPHKPVKGPNGHIVTWYPEYDVVVGHPPQANDPKGTFIDKGDNDLSWDYTEESRAFDLKGSVGAFSIISLDGKDVFVPEGKVIGLGPKGDNKYRVEHGELQSVPNDTPITWGVGKSQLLERLYSENKKFKEQKARSDVRESERKAKESGFRGNYGGGTRFSSI